VLFHETSSPLVTLDSAACTPVRIFILPEGGTCVYAHGRERSKQMNFSVQGKRMHGYFKLGDKDTQTISARIIL
jgi:hypothetical protein